MDSNGIVYNLLLLFKSKKKKGIIAQELREVIPDAVVESGDMILANGDLVNNFLHVNKVSHISKP